MPGICNFASAIKITGTIKDIQGNTLQRASIVFTNGTSEYKTTSAVEGSYLISIPYTGIEQKYSDIYLYSNIPNPFSDITVIPVYIKNSGSLVISIYNLDGQKYERLPIAWFLRELFTLNGMGTGRMEVRLNGIIDLQHRLQSREIQWKNDEN